MNSGRRKTVSETKQASVLDAALAHFLKHGYTRAAMADIARDADVSTATLYKYYASKEDLFTAVARKAAEAVRETVGEIQQNATAAETFTRLLHDYHAAQQEGRVNDLLRIVIAEARSSPKLAHDVFEAIVGMRHRNVKAILDLMVGHGVLKPHDTDLGATLGMGMIKELFVWPALFDPNYKFPNDALAQAGEAVDTYLALHGVDAGGKEAGA